MTPLRALVLIAASVLGAVTTSDRNQAPVRALLAAPGIVVPQGRTRAVAAGFSPDDPLAADQWYIARTRVFDAWTELPPLAPVRVAVIDSGVDRGHPELVGRIAAARSFVGGSVRDTEGHGTIVAGIVAAEIGNGVGIAGLAPSAELLIAKVVGRDGAISVAAEAKAIRWAVDQGARVINLSLGGVRDPSDPDRDDYSALEADAVSYAVRKGVLVVAAVGNGDQAPREPWPYADYPAALPHVLGVSAIARSGASPSFSNRDRIFNDLAAPGVAVISTFPRELTAARFDCEPQGYTPCASDDFVEPEGTSFAAPQATAVAANLLAVRPDLRAEQLAAILTRTARDGKRATGCGKCTPGRDALTGWGELDGAAALRSLARPLPPRDRYEPNDDAGSDAYRLYLTPGSRGRTVHATAEFWNDPDDVHALYLRRGDRLFAGLAASAAGDLALALWRPGTVSVGALAPLDRRVAVSSGPGAAERLSYTADGAGWHFLQVRLTAPGGPTPYRLSVVRASAAS